MLWDFVVLLIKHCEVFKSCTFSILSMQTIPEDIMSYFIGEVPRG